MMRRFFQISFLIIGLILFFSACEEVIELPLKEAGPILVIEGGVSNLSSQQVVLLSEMQPFNSITKKKPISGAEVFLNENNGNWNQLTEENSGKYILNDFKGKPESTYGLLVNYNGEVYEASSKMPKLVRIDSVGITMNTFDDFRRTPLVLYQDPPNIKNYYYYQLRINGEKSSSLFLYNDKFNDGKYIVQNLDDFKLDLVDKDSVVVELRNIDKVSFNYWDGVRSQGGLSTSPGNPPSNISNGALGYFSAYSANSVYFIVD